MVRNRSQRAFDLSRAIGRKAPRARFHSSRARRETRKREREREISLPNTLESRVSNEPFANTREYAASTAPRDARGGVDARLDLGQVYGGGHADAVLAFCCAGGAVDLKASFSKKQVSLLESLSSRSRKEFKRRSLIEFPRRVTWRVPTLCENAFRSHTLSRSTLPSRAPRRTFRGNDALRFQNSRVASLPRLKGRRVAPRARTGRSRARLACETPTRGAVCAPNSRGNSASFSVCRYLAPAVLERAPL